ncbi:MULTISPECIES: hypothetical protein [Myxococcus]|nr:MULTISPECIES: hypothetical protein [Myxococcus]QZZ54970.1 hypothetical protein MyxoNM_38040 [Myxococcus xanthus]UYI14591.1 hypothetical protein N3T43_36960 [Myxococcus xanthus]UYI21959.1 hypothetical protein N1129_37425 [Myxococcus xanthus]SDY17607.1 hypothetical protein SAMN05444383_12252 [Myxococcus xanthus]
MAQRDKQQQPGIQPPEDYYGRTEEPRQHAPETEESEEKRDLADAAESPEVTHRMRTIDPTERTPGAILDEIGDGDGPRSDAGTNPLPDTYWSAYPYGEPQRE